MQVLSIGKRKRVHAVAFAPDGNELAAVSGDDTLRLWNLATGEARLSVLVARAPMGYDLAYLGPNRLAFSGANLNWWDTANDGWYTIAPGYSWGRQLAVSPGGEFLVEVGQTRSTEWAGPALTVRATTDWAIQPTMPEGENTTGGVAFSADRRFLATGHIAAVGHRTRRFSVLPGVEFQQNEYDYLVHVREMPTGRVVQSIDGWQQAVTHLAFSPDGSVLAGTAGPRLRAWDLKADRELAVHKRGPKHFQGLSFSHDGRFLATVSNDATVRLWDARTWEERSRITWDVGALLNIAFAPDGLRAAAGSDRGHVVIWDVE